MAEIRMYQKLIFNHELFHGSYSFRRKQMSDQIEFSLLEVAEMLEEKIFQRISELSNTPRQLFDKNGELLSCRGGAAIGVKKNGKIQVLLSEINPGFADYWRELDGRYAGYAAMKAITALQDEKPTADTGEFNFSSAVHRGGCPRYLPEYGAWISIAFSGFESWEDEDIAAQVLEEFFPMQEVPSLRPASFHP